MVLSFISLLAQETRGGFKVLAFRDYRQEVKTDLLGSFVDECLNGQRPLIDTPPVIRHRDATFFWARAPGSNVFAVSASRWDANALQAVELLKQVLALVQRFCPPSQSVLAGALAGASHWNQPLRGDHVREKSALVLSLLEEVCAFGHPQLTHAESLTELLAVKAQPSGGKVGAAVEALLGARRAEGSKGAAAGGGSGPAPTLDVTGAVPWRKPGLTYKKNEVYLDAIEKVSALVAQDGQLLSGSVQGSIQMRVSLSGMPECKIGLNDKLMMEAESHAGALSESAGRPTATTAQRAGKSQVALNYVRFHQSVRLQAYESDKEVHFVPPDGEFELMSYTVQDNFTLPFRVISTYQQLGRTRAEVNIKLRADFPSTLTAFQVLVWVPLPKNTVKVSMDATGGKTKPYYVELDKHRTKWKISELRGGREHKFSATIEMMPGSELGGTQAQEKWEKPPLRLSFQIPMFTATGLRIRFLKVFEKSGYQPTKWVRYVTTAGDYEVRMGG